MTAPNYSIRDAAWIIADHLAPEPADHAARRAAADKARKRIIYAAARPDALFAIVAGTVERDGFLRWAALTYPGYRPPAGELAPVVGVAHGSLPALAIVGGFGLVLPAISDDQLRDAWIAAEKRAFELQRQLDDSVALVAALDAELRRMREADKARREVNQANARRPRNL